MLRAPDYTRLLDHPTEWTQRIMPSFRDTQRSIMLPTGSMGQGIGGAATAVHFNPAPGQEAALRARITTELQPKLMAMPEIVAAHLWEPAANAAEPTALRPPGLLHPDHSVLSRDDPF